MKKKTAPKKTASAGKRPARAAKPVKRTAEKSPRPAKGAKRAAPPKPAAPTAAVAKPGSIAKSASSRPIRATGLAAVTAAVAEKRTAQAVRTQPLAKIEERYAGLSESDLLRMPASQYMNPGQLGFFREKLFAMQRELLDKAGMTSEHLREHDIESDPTDQATIEEEYALELRTRDRERKLLKKIQQALQRIEDGSYGYCEETGEPIGIPRLVARPTATLTIEAQARRELKQKLYGD